MPPTSNGSDMSIAGLRSFGLAFIVFSQLSLLPASQAQDSELFRSWNQPFKPFRILANIYYVGANEIASYLITTEEGHILLDGGFAETAAIIEANVKQLGFRLKDVKILLNSHAHLDHAGGLAELKRLTGAQLMIMDGDVEEISTGGVGGHPDFAFPPAKVDKVLHDREFFGQ